MPAQEFYSWLMEQTDRDDPVGDLSNDVKRDKKAPIESDDFDTWAGHLIAVGASTVAFEALKEAWVDYTSN